MTSLSGPDVVIAGAARCGTSFLAARLGEHPGIDPGAVKEPEYFGRRWDRGRDWYESLYEPRENGLLRLDGSMSYTVPTYPEALQRLAAASPGAYLIYAVRDPLRRALSHYRLLRQYFVREESSTFGAAIRANTVYLGTSDYDRWLESIYSLFPAERVLVTPFEVTTQGEELTSLIYRELGLPPMAANSERGLDHRNQVVEFRHDAFLRARRLLMQSGAYPWLRRRIGSHRMRQVRSRLTKEAPVLSLEEALGSCDAEQLAEIHRLQGASTAAVARALTEQDRRLGLSWADVWHGSAKSTLPQPRTTSPESR